MASFNEISRLPKQIIIIIKKRKKNLILRNSSEGYNKRNYVLKNLEKEK